MIINIKKKYKKIEDYFTDKEQLKRYKNNKLMPMEKIVLTNNNTISNLSLNINDFGDAIITFENCAFNSLNVVNNLYNYSTLKILNCSINEGNIFLNSKSNIEIDGSYFKKGYITARDISVSNLTTNTPLDVCNINLGAHNTRNINISNITQENASSIILNLIGNNAKINDSECVLNPNCFEINISNSKIVFWKLGQIKNFSISNSCISTYVAKPKILSCSTCSISGETIIGDLVLTTDFLHISKDSSLSPHRSTIDVQNLVLMESNSRINEHNTDEFLLNASNIYLNSGASINAGNLKYYNEDTQCKKLSIKKEKTENKALVKILQTTKNNDNNKE